MKLNAYLARCTAAASLGGFLFGFDTAVISGTTADLTLAYQLTPALLGVTVASALWGAIVGAMFAGLSGERFGRRDSLRGLAVLYVISALGSALGWNWNALLIFRVIGGICIGASSVLSPMYIAEISPANLRGRLVGFFQFNIVLGILLAYFSNYLIVLQHFGSAEWRWELGVAAIPAAIFLIMLFTIPRSPRWLVKKGRIEEARAVFQHTGEPNFEQELQDIVQSIHFERQQSAEKLFSKKYLFPIFLAVTIGMFNQLSGINAVLYYLNDIFARAGFSKLSGNLQAVAVGTTNLIFTILAMSMIDKIGRKTLLLVGAVGMALCHAGIAAIFFSHQHQQLLLWLLVGFIASFAFSQGMVVWVYLSEVFPNVVRAKGQSLGSFSHWVTNAAISGTFPAVAAASGGYPFVFFAAMMVLQFFVVLFVYPETTGLSLEEMQKKMGIG